jgi:hypothetical protein
LREIHDGEEDGEPLRFRRLKRVQALEPREHLSTIQRVLRYCLHA